MSVQFIGNVAWEDVEDPVWTVDSYGTDHAAVLYRGSRLLKKAFEDGLNKNRWGAMAGFNGMRLANWTETIVTPNFPGITLNFVGFRNETIPPVKIVDSLCTQSTSGSGTDTATSRNVTGTFTYKAARTTYSWFETKVPDLVIPRYGEVSDKSDPLSRIITYSIQDSDTLQPINSVPLSAFVAVFNHLIRRIVVTNYEREQLIPNVLWGCQSVVEFQANP